jgi:GNAT superfamily N-acetyltransferase
MDMLIKLYAQSGFADLPSAEGGDGLSADVAPAVLRKPIGAEHAVIVAWIAKRFGPGWASEAQVALSNRPISLWIATRPGELLGFACFDATARGMFGPIGVAESARGQGLGAKLLRACLQDMRSVGYAYAVVGSVGAAEFFTRVAGAVEIPDSTPGLYAGQLRS